LSLLVVVIERRKQSVFDIHLINIPAIMVPSA